ncbi:YncE family protein [Zooshikella sp. RANM57]|uniref:YncE family protein n=1 Tax=Zooshikella sp. RANM57 TaxID=3425863 RepID=UPI003D6EF7EE
MHSFHRYLLSLQSQHLAKKLYSSIILSCCLLLSSVFHNTISADEVNSQGPRRVIFVGNNWEGMIDVIDAKTYVKVGRINGVPDKQQRMTEITFNPIKLIAFQAIRHLIGEGHDQLVDDMYSTNDGRLLIVSRPSFADVVGIDITTNDIVWRFPVKGIRSDHMALSPDGSQVAVSASTGKVVHILDVETGKELGQFPSGDSPHENVYSQDGSKIYHASIGMVFTPLDEYFLDFTKGKRQFQVVDTKTLSLIKHFNMADKLKEAGLHNLSPAIRPMTHTPDERFFYFQLSFLHGFVEYDMQENKITRLAMLPNLVPDMPITEYVNDSAHHGIAMNNTGDTLCVAGTMDDYVALVDRNSFDYQVLTGLGEKPYWVTSDQTGEHCYISWSGTDQMSVISYKSRKEIIRINVGDHPQRIREGYVPAMWTGY